MNRLPSGMERNIASEIEMTKCSVHGEHPKITFTEEGFSISCCCEKFHKDTFVKFEKASKDAGIKRTF